MRRGIIYIVAAVALLSLASCEKLVLELLVERPLTDCNDKIDARREKRNIHPFELYITTSEPELSECRFYGDRQDSKTSMDPTPNDWFELSYEPDGSFSFVLDCRWASLDENIRSNTSIYLHPTEGVHFELNKCYYFGDYMGAVGDGYILEDSYMELYMFDMQRENPYTPIIYTSTSGWIKFTHYESYSGSALLMDNAQIIDAEFYFETVDAESGEVIMRAENCKLENCWGEIR